MNTSDQLHTAIPQNPALLNYRNALCSKLLAEYVPAQGRDLTNNEPAYTAHSLTMNYNRHCRLEFSEYVQTHEEHDNSLNPHTIGALASRPRQSDQPDALDNDSNAKRGD